MELSDAIRARRMVRSFDPDQAVAPEVVARMLDHATRAPSAGFSQGWDFLVLREEHVRAYWQTTAGAALADPDPWLRGMSAAPLLVVCLSNKAAYLERYAEQDKGWTDRDDARWPIPYWDVDTGMAALLLLLGAVDEGLGACFVGVPPGRHDAVREQFAIPADRRLVGVVAIGHAAADRRSPSLRRGRRPLAEVAHEGRFGTPLGGFSP